MAPKLFITGSTGYIGGSVLDAIVKQHPEYEVTVLLRNIPDNFNKLYPHVQIVKGDYDSSDVISDAASKANVVVHNGNSDHPASIKAIIAGLLKGSEPSFYIHLSGTGITADWHDPIYLGKLNPKIWSDVENVDEIRSRPDGELHRVAEKIVLEAGTDNSEKIKTAIIAPPDIYGPGKGPGRTQSVFFPVFWDEIKNNIGAPFYAEEGANSRSWVHIDDLMTVYVKLIEAAIAGGKGADWGKEGYYFASSQETSQIEVAKATAKILHSHGRIEAAEPKQVSLETVAGTMKSAGLKDIGLYMFAANSRTRAHRAPKLFGYEAKGQSLWECIEADLLACSQ